MYCRDSYFSSWCCILLTFSRSCLFQRFYSLSTFFFVFHPDFDLFSNVFIPSLKYVGGCTKQKLNIPFITFYSLFLKLNFFTVFQHFFSSFFQILICLQICSLGISWLKFEEPIRAWESKRVNLIGRAALIF